MKRRRTRRPAFTVAELVVGLAVLVGAMVLVAQLAVWGLQERSRATDRQEALEAAENVLETARARPWDELTADWAKKQRLPETSSGELTVRVEPEQDRPLVKRVTVTVGWGERQGGVRPSVRLVGLFAARQGAKGEGS